MADKERKLCKALVGVYVVAKNFFPMDLKRACNIPLAVFVGVCVFIYIYIYIY